MKARDALREVPHGFVDTYIFFFGTHFDLKFSAQVGSASRPVHSSALKKWRARHAAHIMRPLDFYFYTVFETAHCVTRKRDLADLDERRQMGSVSCACVVILVMLATWPKVLLNDASFCEMSDVLDDSR